MATKLWKTAIRSVSVQLFHGVFSMHDEKKIASGHSASPDVSILTDWMLGSVRTALLDLALELELPYILHKTGTLKV